MSKDETPPGPGGDTPPASPGERVAKAIARAGVASRREAETLITAGRVAVNGTVLDSPAFTVTPDDLVTVDGKPLPAREPARLWRFHKPPGLVTTNRDEKGRETIFDRLPSGLPRVVTVGRLDLTSEGLLLLTNDGELKRQLELPANAWVRRYRVRIYGRPSPETLASLADGITVDGVRYGGIEAALDKQQGDNAWLTMALKEGKNREIRRVMEHLGYPVSRLIRTSYGPFHLGLLPKGAVEEVPAKALKEMVRGAIAGEASDAQNAARETARTARRSRRQAGKPQTLAPQPTGGAPAKRSPMTRTGAQPGVRTTARVSAKASAPAGAKAGAKVGAKPPRSHAGSATPNRGKSNRPDRSTAQPKRPLTQKTTHPSAADRLMTAPKTQTSKPISQRPARGTTSPPGGGKTGNSPAKDPGRRPSNRPGGRTGGKGGRHR